MAQKYTPPEIAISTHTRKHTSSHGKFHLRQNRRILTPFKRRQVFTFSFDCVQEIGFFPSRNFRLHLQRCSSSKIYLPSLNYRTTPATKWYSRSDCKTDPYQRRWFDDNAYRCWARVWYVPKWNLDAYIASVTYPKMISELNNNAVFTKMVQWWPCKEKHIATESKKLHYLLQ